MLPQAWGPQKLAGSHNTAGARSCSTWQARRTSAARSHARPRCVETLHQLRPQDAGGIFWTLPPKQTQAKPCWKSSLPLIFRDHKISSSASPYMVSWGARKATRFGQSRRSKSRCSGCAAASPSFAAAQRDASAAWVGQGRGVHCQLMTLTQD